MPDDATAAQLPRTVQQVVCDPWVAMPESYRVACGRSHSGWWCRTPSGPLVRHTGQAGVVRVARSACA